MQNIFPFLHLKHKIVLGFLMIFPSIIGVALCNSRAMGEEHKDSDIDLFIIARSGKLWTARFLTTLFSTLFGIRRGNTHGLEKGSKKYIKKTKNKFCLSFFITEDGMNFSSIHLQPTDPYLDRWIETLIPLINKKEVFERFWKINSNNHIIHPGIKESKNQRTLFENIIKNLWLPRTLGTYEKLGKPWGVVISDTMLKFHDNDQRKIYQERGRKE